MPRPSPWRPALVGALACSRRRLLGGEAVARRRRRRTRRRPRRAPVPGHRRAGRAESRCRSRFASSARSIAYPTVAVRAQITGELTSVNFKEGDDVEKGQVLFTLDRRPLEAALQQAQANLQRDIAQAANAQVAGAALSGSRRARHRHARAGRSRSRDRRRGARGHGRGRSRRASRTRRCSCSTRRSPRRSPAAPAR